MAVAETVIVADTVAPGAGEEMETVGGMLSTVTLTAAELAVLPAASRATAVKLWLPFAFKVVFQETEYGGVVTSTPRFVPSSLNCTPTTPTLSVAFAATMIVLATVVPAVGAEMETVGGVVSFITVNTLELVAVPPGVVTLSGPLVAPLGTVA